MQLRADGLQLPQAILQLSVQLRKQVEELKLGGITPCRHRILLHTERHRGSWHAQHLAYSQSGANTLDSWHSLTRGVGQIAGLVTSITADVLRTCVTSASSAKAESLERARDTYAAALPVKRPRWRAMIGRSLGPVHVHSSTCKTRHVAQVQLFSRSVETCEANTPGKRVRVSYIILAVPRGFHTRLAVLLAACWLHASTCKLQLTKDDRDDAKREEELAVAEAQHHALVAYLSAHYLFPVAGLHRPALTA